jgi:hypothetical protein
MAVAVVASAVQFVVLTMPFAVVAMLDLSIAYICYHLH